MMPTVSDSYLHIPSYLHTLSPFAVQLSEHFGVRWYGLSYIAGFLLSYLFARWMIRRKLNPLRAELVGDFISASAMGCIIGGRLGYCLFYHPQLFLDFRPNLPFWGVLALNEGGMASHGGIIGFVLVCIWFGRKHGISPIALADLIPLGGTLGVFLGRLANFVNGELYGRATSYAWPFSAKFPQEVFTWSGAENLSRLETLAAALKSARSSLALTVNASAGVIDSQLQRIVAASYAGDSAAQSALQTVLTPRYPSQLYAAFLEGLLIFFVLLVVAWKRGPVGSYVGTFFVCYPLARIISEQFREPDLGIGFQLFGLTRGQWLSVAMLIFGVAMILLGRGKAKTG